MKRHATFSIFAVLALASLAGPVFAEEKADSAEALYGEWEIVEMVYHAMLQDFGGPRGGWIKMEKGKISFADTDHNYGLKYPCTIGNGKIEWDQKDLIRDDPVIALGLYEFRDGRLRIIVSEKPNGDRPKDFDAYKSRDVTLLVLRQVAK